MARHALLKLSNGRFKKVALSANVSIVSIEIIKKERPGRPRQELSPRDVVALRSLRTGGDYITMKDWMYPTLYTKVREIGVQLGRKFHIDQKNDRGLMHITRKK